MPKYELMYILGGQLSENEISDMHAQIEKIVSGFGAANISQEKLGKKKLAYEIAGTKNGEYGLVTFEMEPSGIAQLDAKLRTMKKQIIRFLLLKRNEYFKRAAKDKANQTQKGGSNEIADETTEKTSNVEMETPEETIKAETSETNTLEEQIEAALTENI